MDMETWTGMKWFSSLQCRVDNGTTGSVKYTEFLHQVNSRQLLKKDSAPWNQLIVLFKTDRCD
jgi:hypothetical protein